MINEDGPSEIAMIQTACIRSLTPPYSIGDSKEGEQSRLSVLTLSLQLCVKLLKSQLKLSQIAFSTRPGMLVADSNPFTWNRVKISIMGLVDGDVLNTNDVLADVAQMADSSLVMCVLPIGYKNGWINQFESVHSISHGQTIFIFPIDIIALSDGSWTLEDMLNYKLYRVISLGKRHIETPYDPALFSEFSSTFSASPIRDLSSVIQEFQDEENWIVHPRTEEVYRILRSGTDTLLVGASSSGKSTLTFQVGRRYQRAGHRVLYLDMGSLSLSATSRLLSLITRALDTNDETLLILDDLQSGPSTSAYLLRISKLVRISSDNPPFSILAVCWPTFAVDAAQELGSPRVLQLSSKSVKPALAERRNVTESQVKSVELVAGEDLYIYRLLLENSSDNRVSLNRTHLAEQIWVRRIHNYSGDLRAAKRVVFLAGLLGCYELELTDDFLAYESGVTQADIALLCECKLLRRNNQKIGVGHRSLCVLLTEWLARDIEVQQYYVSRYPTFQPPDLVLAYIRSLDGADIWSALHTIYAQVGFRGDTELKKRTQDLIYFWQALDSLIESIEQQTLRDPTWASTLSSIEFAVEALSDVGKKSQARKSIEFMRSHWVIEGGTLKVLGGTAERLDFDQVKKTMMVEDIEQGLDAAQGRQASTDVDMDRFHQMWVAGLILCAEASYAEFSSAELQKLAFAVERLQSVDGYFYPRRVPWNTARVITGLARCGRTYYTSEVVRKACDWLLASSDTGGALVDGKWYSGTGKWNTTLLSTVMCISALVEAGIDPNDKRLSRAARFLMDNRAEWESRIAKVDGAMTIEAILLLKGDWKFVSEDVRLLIQQVLQEDFWDSANVNARDSFDESSTVATIASYLTRTTWYAIRSELPELLAGLAVTEPFGHTWHIQRGDDRVQQLLGPTSTEESTPVSGGADNPWWFTVVRLFRRLLNGQGGGSSNSV